MSRDSIKNPCPVTCPKVKEQLRNAIKELPNVTDGIFPRKKNDVEPRFPTDIISRDIQDEPIRKFPIIQEPTVIPTEEIADIKEKIDLIEKKKLIQESAIIPKEIVIPTEEIIDRDKEKINFVEKKELIEEPVIVQEAITLTEKTIDKEKIDLITEEKLDQEPVIIQEETVIPTKIVVRDEEKDSVVEKITVEPKKVPIKEPEIIENDIERTLATKIEFELELSRKLEDLEPEESMTDYEKYIDEELQKSLPAVIAREIPEEPKTMREISRNAAILYERIDRERPVRPPRERKAVTAMPEERPTREEVSVRRALENSTITEQIVSRKPAAIEDACKETCPLVKEQKERIMRKLKVRQQVVDRYYLTKGFSYFEDVCTCSLACMVYTLSRDPFVKKIFASLALFTVGLKLCSELNAWEMPSRVS